MVNAIAVQHEHVVPESMLACKHFFKLLLLYMFFVPNDIKHQMDENSSRPLSARQVVHQRPDGWLHAASLCFHQLMMSNTHTHTTTGERFDSVGVWHLDDTERAPCQHQSDDTTHSESMFLRITCTVFIIRSAVSQWVASSGSDKNTSEFFWIVFFIFFLSPVTIPCPDCFPLSCSKLLHVCVHF